MGATLAISVSSDGTLALGSKAAGGWNAGAALSLKGGIIDLNGLSPIPTVKPTPIQNVSLPDTVFATNVGWEVQQGKIITIVSRAPTHEPYPYHNLGVPVNTALSDGGDTSSTPTLPPDFDITRDE